MLNGKGTVKEFLSSIGYNINTLRIVCPDCNCNSLINELTISERVVTEFGASINYCCPECNSVVAVEDENF